MPLTLVEIEEGKLRGRLSVTPQQGELTYDAVADGLADLLASLPLTHRGRVRLYIDPEYLRRGRSTSRRVFLTLIAEPSP